MGSPSAYSLIFVGESGEDLMLAGGSYHLASAYRYPLAGVNWVLRFPLFFGYVVRRTLILGTKNLSLGRKTSGVFFWGNTTAPFSLPDKSELLVMDIGVTWSDGGLLMDRGLLGGSGWF